MTRHIARIITSMLIVPLLAGVANALINPNFTPLDMVEQSGMIVVLDVPEKIEDGVIRLRVTESLKGEMRHKSLGFDLSKTTPPEHGEAARQLLAASAGRTALLFTGQYEQRTAAGVGSFGDGGFDDGGFAPNPGGGGEEITVGAFLHVSGKWIALDAVEAGEFEASKISKFLEQTWAGGTDMLCRAVRYILTDEDPEMPSTCGGKWGSELKITTLEGKVSSAQPVWLGDQRRPYLFLACEEGDRLFRFDVEKQQFDDITELRKLDSKSQAAAWGDLNGDGRLDLAGWEGESLVVHLQTGDGTFRRKTIVPPGLVKPPCLGLAIVDGAAEARVAVVISTSADPQLLMIREDGSSALEPVAAGEQIDRAWGPAGPCLVADFDGDLLPDLLQPFAVGSRLYRGDRQSIFTAPTACAVALGKGRSAAFLGDYDADGALDVVAVSEDPPRLWHNLGQGKFVETRGLSGEFAYISLPYGIGGATGDVDNDGRQDVLVFYSNHRPHVFFNRGFRSFGHARSLDLHLLNRLPAAADGQQAGCVGDFAGYGAQDMVLVLDGGEVWALLRDEEYEDSLYVGVSPAAGGPFAGPLTVSAEANGRDLGAWNVTPGGPAAFFGRREAGPCTIKWQLPGGQPQRKEIIVEEQPIWFSIR